MSEAEYLTTQITASDTCFTGEDIEDLISIGTIGLIKAIEKYSPDKGAKMATFATRCIENENVMSLEVQ